MARGEVVSTWVARGPPARSWVARGPLCGKKSQDSESFIAWTYIVGRTGGRESRIDWRVKAVPAFPPVGTR